MGGYAGVAESERVDLAPWGTLTRELRAGWMPALRTGAVVEVRRYWAGVGPGA